MVWIFKRICIFGIVTIKLVSQYFWSFLSYQMSWCGNCSFLFLLYHILVLEKILLHLLVEPLPEDSNGYGRGNDKGWWVSVTPMAIDSMLLEKYHCLHISATRASPKTFVQDSVIPITCTSTVPPFQSCKKEFHLNDLPMLDHSLSSRWSEWQFIPNSV